MQKRIIIPVEKVLEAMAPAPSGETYKELQELKKQKIIEETAEGFRFCEPQR